MVMDFSQKQNNASTEVEFEKVEQIAILSKNNKGWTTELNRVSYNGRPAVLDLRNWGPDGRMGKGMTLADHVAENLFLTLQVLFQAKAEEELEQESEQKDAMERTEMPPHHEETPPPVGEAPREIWTPETEL